MQIINKPIKELIPYEKNPRKNDEAVKYVKASIEQFGFKVPIVIDAQGVIVAGHTRLKAAKELGMKEVPCIVADDLNEEQIKAFRLVDNKTGEAAEWDVELLNTELLDLEANFDMSDFGFEIYPPTGEVSDDDFDADAVADAIVDPVTKLGDIWALGRHRLMCGDSTDMATVGRLMDGAKADMVFTDPPYRMEAQGGSNQWVGRAAAKLGETIESMCDFEPKAFLDVLPSIFNGNMNCYIFCNKDLVVDYLTWCVESGYAYNILFWKKPNAIPLGEQHRPDVEYLLFCRKNATWNNGLKDAVYSKCLEFGRENSTSHPTMKPVELIANEIKISSKSGGNVVDPFGGSGSTLIACEQLNRTCYMMELDQKYCDVIIKRWESLTGQKAVLNG